MPGQHSGRSYIMPGRHSGRSHIMPGRHSDRSHIMPARHSDCSRIMPGQHSDRSHIMPGQHSSRSRIMPARHSDCSRIMPARHTDRSQEYSGKDDSRGETLRKVSRRKTTFIAAAGPPERSFRENGCPGPRSACPSRLLRNSRSSPRPPIRQPSRPRRKKAPGRFRPSPPPPVIARKTDGDWPPLP